MNCADIKDLLSAYYDNELVGESRITVRAHLEQCEDCAIELSAFRNLSSLARSLNNTDAPDPDWSAVERAINQETLPRATPASTRKYDKVNFRPIRTIAVSLAVFVCVFGFYLYWTSNNQHDHFEMQVAMETVVRQIDSDQVTNLLLNKFGGSEVSTDDAFNEVGYRPLVERGLPEGYQVASVQVLTMPCCKCIQTICRRKDNSKLFIYEHTEEDTGWFEDRPSEQVTVDGEVFDVIKIGDLIVATCKKDKRHVTYLGLRSADELTQIAQEFRG